MQALRRIAIMVILANFMAIIWLLLTQAMGLAEIGFVTVLSVVNLISLSKLIK